MLLTATYWKIFIQKLILLCCFWIEKSWTTLLFLLLGLGFGTLFTLLLWRSFLFGCCGFPLFRVKITDFCCKDTKQNENSILTNWYSRLTPFPVNQKRHLNLNTSSNFLPSTIYPHPPPKQTGTKCKINSRQNSSTIPCFKFISLNLCTDKKQM